MSVFIAETVFETYTKTEITITKRPHYDSSFWSTEIHDEHLASLLTGLMIACEKSLICKQFCCKLYKFEKEKLLSI